MIEILGVFVTVFLSIYFLILCTAKKKKRDSIASVKFSVRNSGVINDDDAENAISVPGSEAASTTHTPTATLTNQNEEQKAHSQSQTSQIRELPQPPPTEDEVSKSQRNSLDCMNSNGNEPANGEGDKNKHPSPKGRRLPAPPPENALKTAVDDQDPEEDPYASVDDEEKKSELIRFKLKTLDIKEGSGDSTFYAKVTDNPEEEEDTGLYAQVDDKGIEEKSAKVVDVVQNSVPSTSNAVPAQSGAYAAPEYASIDKIKKSIKRKPANSQAANEPLAPPIPDRNFDAEDEANGETEEPETSPQNDEEEEEEEEKVPMYDKLCVRESLDHLRKREVLEKERRERYENLPIMNGGESSSDLYAQIDENNAEAVYESLSQPGSADGTFQVNVANPDYSSISELNDSTEPSNRNPAVNLQARPQRQHHYEQIERSGASS